MLKRYLPGWVWISLIVLLVLLLGGWFARWGLSRAALPLLTKTIAQRTGWQVSIDSMGVSLWHGFVFNKVQVTSPSGSREEEVEVLRVKPRWMELLRKRQVVIEGFSVDFAEGRLEGKGEWSFVSSKTFQMTLQCDRWEVIRDSQTWGVLSGTVDVSGDWQTPRVLDVRGEMSLKSAGKRGPSFLAESKIQLQAGRGEMVTTYRYEKFKGTLNARIDLPHERVVAKLEGNQKLPSRSPSSPMNIDSFSGSLEGGLTFWNTRLRVHLHAGDTFSYAGRVTSEVTGWRIGWNTLAWRFPDGYAWYATEPGFLKVSSEGTLRIHDLSLTDSTGTLRVSETVVGSDRVESTLSGSQISLGALAHRFAPDQKIQGSLNTQLHVSGSWAHPKGEVQIDVVDAQMNGWTFPKVHVAAHLASPWVMLDKFVCDLPVSKQTIVATGKIPLHFFQDSAPDVPMDLNLHSTEVDPAFLVKGMPELEIETGGHLKFEAHAEGRMSRYVINGQLSAQIPRVRLREAGMDLKDINLSLRSQGQQVEVERFEGKLGKGHWQVTGQSRWPKLDYQLTANGVTLDIPKQLDLKTDAQLTLSGSINEPELTGGVHPKSGTYNSKKSKDKKAPSTEPPPAFWQRLRMEVAAEWSHGLWYREGLTKIETSADLKIRKAPGANDVSLVGPLTLIRGSYDAYGKDFKIDNGSLMFTGSIPINPSLNIQAVYRTAEVIVNLTVLGTAEHPELKFTSTPPMTEPEIISTLVTGHPSNTVGGSATSTETQSKDAAAEVASSYLTQSLREQGLDLGLDVIRVTPSSTGTIWTVGRYVGPRLFVSYGQNPKDSASTVVNADYILTRRWSLNTQASTTDNFFDFIFRYPLDRKKNKPK